MCTTTTHEIRDGYDLRDDKYTHSFAICQKEEKKIEAVGDVYV